MEQLIEPMLTNVVRIALIMIYHNSVWSTYANIVPIYRADLFAI